MSDESVDRRGVQLLDRLVRELAPDAPRGRRGRALGRAGMPWSTLVAALAGVLVVLGGGWWWSHRPVPVEEQLPMAPRSSDPAATGAASGASTPATPVPPSSGPAVVHVAGAVVHPGLVTVAGGARVADAVRAAGGLRPDADPDRLNLAATVRDGERVAVPVRGGPVPALVGGGGGPADGGGGAAAPVDLNTADAAELEQLPGVGPATAAAIVAHREASGPFASVDDLLDVRGIGEAKLDALRDAATVGP